MQLRRSVLLIVAEAALLCGISSAGASVLVSMDEPSVQIVPPNPTVTPMQYSTVNGVLVMGPITATPIVCGNTSAPATMGPALSPIYYSTTGKTSLKPFVFGASSTTPTVSAPAYGPSLSMSVSLDMRLVQDPALVCYGLDANGVHGPTPHVMRDQFEGVNYSPTLHSSFNSSVAVKVFHIPANSTDFYGYTVDVTIPTKPVNVTCGPSPLADCNFALLEGFDTAVFATNSGHADEGWCIGSAGSNSCSTSALRGGININYSTWPNSFLPQLVAGDTTVTYRFVVKRYFASGVTALPASGGPVAIAALFSPFDLDENFIGDNVAVGYGNTPPAIVQDDASWTAFSGALSALAEATDSGSLSFNLTDSDTSGALNAAVTLNLNGLSVPVTPSCSSSSGTGAANSQCTMSINLSDANWWNAAVGSTYQGKGNAFATDPGDVSASLSIVATDALGKSSAAVNVPIHVASTVNNAPVAGFAGQLVSAVDPNNNHVYPTYSCSVGGGTCGGVDRFGNITVDLAQAITAAGGPVSAFDELATQTTAVVAYSDPNDSFTNVQCNREQQAQVFTANGGPIVTPGSGSAYGVNYVLASTPPASTVSALCTVTFTDQGAFPNGQTAKTGTGEFRLVVNP
jgi:hypothetical protein